MSNKSILRKDKRYTFSDYFDLNYPTDEIIAIFGYSLSLQVLHLPQGQAIPYAALQTLQETYYDILPKLTIHSEIGKRDFLIAPLLTVLMRQVDARLSVEYPIEVSDYLCGSLDYLLRAQQQLIVIEAKKGDLDKGFTQLSVELIALDQDEVDNPNELFYGAISIGDVWRFGVLHRAQKLIVKDIHSYSIPADTERVYSTLLGILQEKETPHPTTSN